MYDTFTKYVIFFFQAEDGIRDIGVTGVQTCALPICREELSLKVPATPPDASPGQNVADLARTWSHHFHQARSVSGLVTGVRSEERRVGKECRSRWSPYH